MSEYVSVKLYDENRRVTLHPGLKRVMDAAEFAIRNGGTVYFRWICQHCGASQTFDTPNSLHIKGRCEECNNVSDLLNPSADVSMVFPAGTDIDIIMKLLGDK